jgi:signal transduction histidine kinase
MAGVGLRARLVAAFVGIAAIATLAAALLTSVGLHRSFDDYLEQRSGDAAAAAVALAEGSYAGTGRWTPDSLDLLSHELVLTGYDFRLVRDGRTLLDTAKLKREGVEFRRVSSLPVRGPSGDDVGTLQLYALGPRGGTPADDALRTELDRAHLWAAAIAAMIAIIAGLVVAGRLSRPLRRLAVAARGLAHGNAPSPLPVGGSAEIRDLGEALSGLAGDLDRQQRARRQLAQDLSHELRTPLMLLQSRIEAMQDGIVPFDAEGLAALHTETLRLSRLIGQIERLAETEADPRPMRHEVVALDEVARDAQATLGPAFEIRGLGLEADLHAAHGWGDRDAVSQVVTNLLSNSLKYAPDRSTVRLSTASAGGAARLTVRDDGEALTGPERTRVFDRFYRGPDAARESGGAGLGLTIARNLMLALEGGLDLDQDDASGTGFSLWLPQAPAPSEPPASPRPATPTRSQGRTRGPGHRDRP